ncbi:MAG: endopeptidase La [Anaerolineae bacterium]|jgi:ATP-dependent Lon protease|nr:endopeptidase La [Anaerolineae bacterium]MDX9829603.1 endopeptidase La [Anaerolineae bacterium]
MTQEEIIEIQDQDNQQDNPIPEELAILPLRGVVVFPLTFQALNVGQPRSVRLVDDATVNKQMIGLVSSRDPDVEEPSPSEIHEVGVAAVIHRMIKAPDGTIRLLVQGVERIRIAEWLEEQPYLRARVDVAPDIVEESLEVEALMRNAVDLLRRLVSLVSQLPDELLMAAINLEDPRQLVYFIATNIRMEPTDAQAILELDSVREKLLRLTTIMTKELEVLELGHKIQSEAQSEMERMQRDYFLREQMKAIRKELGEEDEQAVEIEEYRQKIAEAGMPEEAEKEALRELNRMEKMPPQAAEYSVIKTYLDWLTDMPWQLSTEDQLDIEHARQVLNEDHYDLEDIKDRILEYLAVRKLRQERRAEREEREVQDVIRQEREGVILCFVGPPGTGKTSLGQSIARAMGRKFIRMSLGGMRDEAEIRGHRRTYIGAMPGRIIQGLKRVGTRNPVFMLDEIDKVGSDWRGDPSSALLEVLDPEQNRDFRDHYLDVPFDLSQVMFVTTANVLSTIPAPLRDRMEILELDGYTEDEKVRIAQEYLLPRQIRENSLRADEVSISDDAMRVIARDYTREAGVRNLEREIGTICRKVATRVAEREGVSVTVDAEDVAEYLGKPRFYFEPAERTEVPGVATGLVWTPTGGDITFIEATRMKGNRRLTLTGKLGDVMKESAQAAVSYVRSKAGDLGIDEESFTKSDIHIHVPAGAVPKDGPSAGVTIATALVSLLTGRNVRSDVAMTGEITLRGQVLPVGGIKQKVLAAARVGIKNVILPARNEVDLDDIPEEIREDLHFVFAERVDDVFAAALHDGAEIDSE